MNLVSLRLANGTSHGTLHVPFVIDWNDWDASVISIPPSPPSGSAAHREVNTSPGVRVKVPRENSCGVPLGGGRGAVPAGPSVDGRGDGIEVRAQRHERHRPRGEHEAREPCVALRGPGPDYTRLIPCLSHRRNSVMSPKTLSPRTGNVGRRSVRATGRDPPAIAAGHRNPGRTHRSGDA